MDEKELDHRIRCLPPAYGTRHFKNGISALSQISGSERKDMARVLLGCLVGRIPHALMLTLRALLDFIYIAQYPTHDDQTLKYLEDALKEYHKNKDILKTLEIREHLNIPKFHSLVHYIESIRSLGTTDNYNTEMFERLHIDCAKKAWRASNHRNERAQMTKWLERREKIAIITDRHAAPGFAKALNQHVYSMKLGRPLTSHEQEVASSYLPFSRVDVYHTLKFTTIALSDERAERDVVKARPAAGGEPARFDTVVVLRGDDAEATGVQGTRIGRLKVIFKLPDTIYEQGSLNEMHAPEEWATQGPLAYVEWYANLPVAADPVHMMYEVRKLPPRADGTPTGEIIPLSMIRQSCQLIPRFPKPKAGRTTPSVPTDWASDNVLDKAQKFLLNNWATKYAYQSLW
ncbi:hypothetical protein FOMPIDRAFT_1114975 [Fomitopsis schrenkii]|uniref:Uncharacterized protein n=1 Tax=Fomitopsis schrenkii TaxID=2126942 RepID=S8EL64_FOMSC|nr:hypothetical protein FOMPIDRAFT_1114975 [Fomitopsis schrenkii]